MILAIDTATQYAGLALCNSHAVVAEETWHSGRKHTVELAPRVARMLKLAGLQVNQLTALAVSLGPGSFTGLRIGLAVAKGLALSHKLPVVGIPTLDITAHPFREHPAPVWAVAQAGRGRIIAACYGHRDETWQQVVAPAITNFEALLAKVSGPALFTGELEAAAIEQLEKDPRLSVAPAYARVRRASVLADIATTRLAASAQDDPDALSPIYLSSP